MGRIATLFSLHPKFRGIAEGINKQLILAYEAGKTQFLLQPFETVRSADRQEEVFMKGASKARAWQSAHQFGLACDWVPYLSTNTNTRDAAKLAKVPSMLPGWFWPRTDHPDWDFLTEVAHAAGCVTISWDRPHVESPYFKKIKGALDDQT